MPASEAARVAMLLAIDEPDLLSDVQLARRVSGGLLPESAMALAGLLGRSRVVGPVIPEATLRRVRKAGRALSRQLSRTALRTGPSDRRRQPRIPRRPEGTRRVPQCSPSAAGRRYAARNGAVQFGRCGSRAESRSSGGGRHARVTTPRTLRETHARVSDRLIQRDGFRYGARKAPDACPADGMKPVRK